MISSPFYDEIKARAVELLNDPAGFNGLPRKQTRPWDRSQRWLIRNAIGVALCQARDVVLARLTDDGDRDARKTVGFNVGNHRKAETEIGCHVFRLTRQPTMTRDAS
jgi:hypothetical protein